MMQNVFFYSEAVSQKKRLFRGSTSSFFLTKTESSPPRFLFHVYLFFESEVTATTKGVRFSSSTCAIRNADAKCLLAVKLSHIQF